MRRIMIMLCIALLSNGLANGTTQKERVERIGGLLYIGENNMRRLIDESTVIVKLRQDVKKLPERLKVLRANPAGYIDVEVPKDVDVTQFVQDLQSSDLFDLVQYAEFAELDVTPNDTYISNQWYLSTINMYSAWNITMGSSTVKVAVIDSEVDRNHEDIGIGTDGYNNINATLGYNYVYNTTNAVSPHFHGTEVAGVIGAKANNGKGIAGISGGNYATGVTVIPYCVGGESGNNIHISMVDDAIYDAVNKGVKVINMSFRSLTSNHPSINAAIEYAYSNGVTLVAASGNDASNVLYYPASHENVIAVGSVDNTLHRSSFSNYGTNLEIVAPGEGIYSTKPGNSYGSDSGTSFATPQVSGVVALMLAANQNLTPANVRDILSKTSTKLPGYTFTSGWNNEVGYGLLNAYAAITAAKCYNKSISGNNKICHYSSATYNLYGLPSNTTVTWSFNRTYGSASPQITPNSATKSCTVYNNCSTVCEGYLTATVKLGGTTIISYSKIIYADVPITGFYWNGAPYNDGYEYTLTEDDNYATPGNVVLIKSDNIKSKSAYLYKSSSPYTHYAPSSQGNDYIMFEMPTLSSNDTYNVTFTGGCNDENFIFRVSNINYLSNHELSVTALGGGRYRLSTNSTPEINDNDKKSSLWKLRVYSATDMQMIKSLQTSSDNCILDLSSCKPGIYIVKTVLNSTPLSVKIALE